MERVVFLTQEVSNYHIARYSALLQEFSLLVLSMKRDSYFHEFLAKEYRDVKVKNLFENDLEYAGAVKSGRLAEKINSFLSEFRPSCIAVAGWAFPETIEALFWARQNGAKIILMSASQESDAVRSLLRESVKSHIVKFFDAALVGGIRQAQYLSKLGFSRERIFTSYNVVDNSHFNKDVSLVNSNLSDEFSSFLSSHNRIYLASARFVPKKNLDRLIVAFSEFIKKSDHSSGLLIIGDGPEKQKIERLVLNLSLSNDVYLPGFVDYFSLPYFYRVSDCFVHVSLSEQWGLVVNEACASALPVIVSEQCGSFPHLLNEGINGFGVDASSISSIVHALHRVDKLSSLNLIEFGLKSKELIDQWGPEKFFSGFRDAVNSSKNSKVKRLGVFDRCILFLLRKIIFRKVR